MTRTRNCDDPAPVGMGADCIGDSEETSISIEESCVGKLKWQSY